MARSVIAYLAYGLFGVSLAVLWDRRACRAGGRALLLLLPLFVARWAYAQYAEEQRAYDRTVRTLMAAVETKDVYTRGHSERVSAASVLIARAIGMREDRVASLRYAGMLHDIGKLGVPTRVLQKSGGLTDDEFAAIQRHPVQGLEIVREIEFLDEANAGIMHHHERLDGLGYPMGLRGAEIPEFARVIAVADAFDSMTTTRSYRGARSHRGGGRRAAPLRRHPVRPADGRGVGARRWRSTAGTRRRRPAVLAAGRRRRSSTRTGGPSTTTTRPTRSSRTPGDAACAVGSTTPARWGTSSSSPRRPCSPSLPSWSPRRPAGSSTSHIALAFGAFIALGELVRITLPGGRDAAPIATAGALGYVLLTRYPDGPATQSALQVVAVVVVAMLVGVAPHAVVGRAPSVDSLARRLLSVGVAAAIFRGTGLDERGQHAQGRRRWRSS